MRMDGYDVKAGDHLWHVTYGAGVVTEMLASGEARITFSNVNYVFGSNLHRAGERVRTLYWQNPIASNPPPLSEAPKYEAWRQIAQAAWNVLVKTPFGE